MRHGENATQAAAHRGYYEVKYRNPQGLVFDLTASGWIGAVKHVKPAEEEARAVAR